MAMQVSSLEPVATRHVESRYRRILTPIPVPESLPFLRRLRELEPRSMGGMPPVVWEEAQGFQVRDPYGNQWIDFTSGIVTANAGHAHPRVMKAIADQACRGPAFSYAFATRAREQALAAVLAIAPAGLDKAILFSSGTEATECAMMLMRRHGAGIAQGKTGIISIEHAYHGRTLAAKFASGAPGLVDGLDRAPAGHVQLPLPGGADSRGFLGDIDARLVDPRRIAGIILESIPGWTTTPYPPDYMRELVGWARAHAVLLTCDEVQAGMGRTGKWFAFEHYGIAPDLVACGKGLTGCVAASAVIGRRDVMDLAEPGEMSSSFGGNPISCAAVAANLEVLREERLVERSTQLGAVLERELRAIAARHEANAGSLNGRGLFWSLHLKDAVTGDPLGARGDEIATECVRRGVLMFVTGRGFLKFVPPLVIEEDALVEGVRAVGEVLDDSL